MKKIYLIFSALLFIFAGLNVFGEVVTTRKINRPQSSQNQTYSQSTTKNTTTGSGTVKKNGTSTTVKTTQTPAITVRPSGNKLADSVKMCKPYSETLDSDMGGVNFRFNIRIEGWVDNKCRLNFTTQSTGINQMFQSLYGIDSSQATIMTFEPKIRCDFTKQQLLSVGDSILQENERNGGAYNNMLKNPQDISFNPATFSNSDIKLMDVILNDKACKILNAPDSNQMFESIFGM